jgi:uncharacterized protein
MQAFPGTHKVIIIVLLSSPIKKYFYVYPYLTIRYFMTFAQEIILLFTRLPKPGNTKTRLIPALGAEGAAALQRNMTLNICGVIRTIARQGCTCVEVHYTGGSSEEMEEWLGSDFTYKLQHEGDIGEKMFAAIQQHLGHYDSIILVGSDCPEIDSKLLQNCLGSLQASDIVIGPAFDGGYYLIGVRGSLNENDLQYLFSGIDWGTSSVFRQTIEKIDTLKLRYHQLKKLHDIDTPEDLRYLHNYSGT